MGSILQVRRVKLNTGGNESLPVTAGGWNRSQDIAMGHNYPSNRQSTGCPEGCTCGRHKARTASAETRAKVSAAQKGVPERHTADCACFRCSPADLAKHGESTRTKRSPEYVAWQNMRARCLRPSHPRYADWGGRGITICERWNDFANFLADVGRRPGLGYSLDRIDNDGNYEPSNCRWTTRSAQQNNQRRSKGGDG